MASTEGTGFPKKEEFELKGALSTKRNGFLKGRLPLKGMVSTTGNIHICVLLRIYLHVLL